MMVTSNCHIRSWLFSLLLVFSAAGSDAQELNNDIYGTWRIDGAAGEIGNGMTEQQARRFMGKTVTISASKFVFNGHTCMSPTYARTVQDKKTYFRNGWQADPSRLPLPNRLIIVDAKCNVVHPVAKNLIIVDGRNGVFFAAVRVRR
jgi:hypothetical protein